jgi:hypothetical protein
MVAKNLGYLARISAAGVEKGISEVVGASCSKTWSLLHASWYFFSLAINLSLLSVFSSFMVFSELLPGSRAFGVAMAALYQFWAVEGLVVAKVMTGTAPTQQKFSTEARGLAGGNASALRLEP